MAVAAVLAIQAAAVQEQAVVLAAAVPAADRQAAVQAVLAAAVAAAQAVLAAVRAAQVAAAAPVIQAVAAVLAGIRRLCRMAAVLWLSSEMGEIMVSFDIVSNCGEREYNEDYTGVQQRGDAYCFLLADGLGGHGGGDEASRLVCECIRSDFAVNGTVSEPYLRRCFEMSQKLLLQEQERQGRRTEMKTTLTVLLADQEQIQWGHIGDSRIYYFQDKKLRWRTLDHSVPQVLVSAGRLKEKQIRGHADRSRLLRVMGIEWEEPQYEIARPLKRMGGEAFLLCTDGFWEWIEERPMQKLLKKAGTPQQWLIGMEAAVRKHGCGKQMDNYSAVAVFL